MNTGPLTSAARREPRRGPPAPCPIYDHTGHLLPAPGTVQEEVRGVETHTAKDTATDAQWRELDFGADDSTTTGAEGDTNLAAPAHSVAEPSGEGQPAFGSMPRTEPPRRKRPLAPWRLLQMWSEQGDAQDALSVKLLGVHEGKSLLVSAPERDGRLAFVKEGNVYRFRGFSGDAVYDFAATLEKVRFEPYPYLHIAWPHPSQVTRQRLRNARRVGCELPCIVYPQPTGAQFIKGRVGDLSATGASIRLTEPLIHSAHRVRLAFRLPVAGEHVLFDALVKPVRTPLPVSTGTPGEDAALGVAFGSLPTLQRLALHAFVYAAIARELETPLYAEI
jgi:c-di-GMP-binding flagellar brake protein YcgR